MIAGDACVPLSFVKTEESLIPGGADEMSEGDVEVLVVHLVGCQSRVGRVGRVRALDRIQNDA